MSLNLAGMDDTQLAASASLASATAVSAGMQGTATFTRAEGASKKDGFRSQNVKFLQDQNKEANRELDLAEEERDAALEAVAKWEQKREEIQREYARLQEQLAETEEKCNISSAEIHKRDEQIRVLSEQNRSLLDMLEKEEEANKERSVNLEELTGTNEALQKISDEYDKCKETGNQELTTAYTEISKLEEELRNARAECEQLQEADRNFQSQAKMDIEALEQKLKEAKDKNVERLQQIQHNEVHHHRLAEGLKRLKETMDELTVQKKGIKMQADMDVASREKWAQSKAEVEHRKAMLEKTAEAMRASLRSAEEQNQRMQDEGKQGADNFRQLGDKVYALMNQLRQHQLDLKKQEQNGADKSKKIATLEKQSQTLQANLQLEVDAKLAAEGEARNAAQMQALLQKKNKMLDEAHQLALKAQEKVEKRLQELTDKANALQTQNDYLSTRIDGNEEDKGALKYELRRGEEELKQAKAINQQLNQRKSDCDDKHGSLEAEKASLKAELDYIRREDMLDGSGRTKPILIESESKLIERLQINEFLYSAQQARNPVPMLVEKVSHILEMLHTAQSQADIYLQDLQRSNSMLTALRSKNMNLYEKVQMCETWKMRALLKIATNEFEMRPKVKGFRKQEDSHTLMLDGLQYTNKELEELKKVIEGYGKQEKVKEIRLRDNALDATAVPLLCELLELCPYLQRLDLKSNKLDDGAIRALEAFVEKIPGITYMCRDPATNDIKAMAGRQLRLVIGVEDQTPPDPADALGAAEGVSNEMASRDAEEFLSSSAGLTPAPKGALLNGYPRGPAAKPGMGMSKSEAILPRISNSGAVMGTGSVSPMRGGRR